ncbi:PTPRM [Mytilus coruscus]|uniref:protein-tyrosine-phosphatase n=1 Tax=Mytilus coruscus TaxID=42192 RepID=A0A6J8ABB4_MYTCO|nr:PTPRM [Mytilus coruscus]
MKGEVVAVVLLFLKHLCQAENVIVGSTKHIVCQIQNGNLWEKYSKGSSVWETINNGGRYSGSHSSNLTISNFKIEDSGKFRCKVDGTVSTEAEIVLKPTVQAFIGSSVSLTCTVLGTQLHWYIMIDTNDQRTLTDNNEYEGSTTNSLEIKSLTADTAAVYYCQPTDRSRGPEITVSISDWSTWTTWGDCSVTCGTGQRERTRTCLEQCTESAVQSAPCTGNLKVDGGWSSWSYSGSCTVSCGSGLQKRIRSCNNPPQGNCGEYCQGVDNNYINCSSTACPVNGGWSSWESWVACNVTCGTGKQSRRRYCNNPKPENSGSYCQGEDYDYKSCTLSACPESKTASEPVAPIAGGVGGGIVLVLIVVIGLIYMKRRRRKPLDDRVSGENQGLQIVDRNVSLRQEGDRQEGMYINIARASRQSSSDTDDAIPSRVSTKDTSTDECNTYYNSSDLLTTVKVEELKDYIKRKQVNEGLHSEYKTIPYGPQHPTSTAQKKENMPKNRYKTTFPYDHTRVILQPVHGSSHMNYINANLVDVSPVCNTVSLFYKSNASMQVLRPLKHTFTDFWTMIWQNNTRKIIMLTNLMEVAKVKCDKYWPEGGKPMVLGNLILTLRSEKERAAYVTREISVEDKKTKEKRNIIQYHFTAWPDHGTPDPLYLVLFHKHVISDHSDVESGKLLVHCSAGIGRTGTYIGLDALYEEGRITGCVDIVKFVKKMRYSRMNMVQTPEQYVCLHYALLEAFTMKDTNIGKEEFGTIWREIKSDKQPINHQKLYKEFKMLEAKKSEHGKSEYTAATSPENMEKNRNKTVIPCKLCMTMTNSSLFKIKLIVE